MFSGGRTKFNNCNCIWDKLSKNEASKIYGRAFEGCLPQVLLGPFLNALSQLFLSQHLIFGCDNKMITDNEGLW